VKPWLDDDDQILYHGDVLEVLRTLPAESVDAVITDPPYNVGKDYGEGHDDRLDGPAYSAWLREVLDECRRVTRDGVIFTPGTRNLYDAAWNVDALEGLALYRTLAWHKVEFAGDKWRGGPAMCWEPILWCSTQTKPYYRKTFGTWGRDFLVVPATHGDPFAKVHPCPKPLRVMKWLVGLFVPDGGLVLDPFCGTGPTLLAAREAGCRGIGIDRSEDYLRDGAAVRLQQRAMAA
jgi:site-specific DNA-methyltransferase (adenine-specific)